MLPVQEQEVWLVSQARKEKEMRDVLMAGGPALHTADHLFYTLPSDSQVCGSKMRLDI